MRHDFRISMRHSARFFLHRRDEACNESTTSSWSNIRGAVSGHLRASRPRSYNVLGGRSRVDKPQILSDGGYGVYSPRTWIDNRGIVLHRRSVLSTARYTCKALAIGRLVLYSRRRFRIVAGSGRRSTANELTRLITRSPQSSFCQSPFSSFTSLVAASRDRATS